MYNKMTKIFKLSADKLIKMIKNNETEKIKTLE